jgi:hypothetical protein
MQPSSRQDFQYLVFLGGIVLCATILFLADGHAVLCEDYPLIEHSLLGSLLLSGGNSTFVVDGSLAYVGGHFQGFKVLDLSDPVQPMLLAEFNTGLFLLNEPTWVEPTGDIGFIGGVYGEVPVVDLSDPSAPSEITRIPILFEVKATASEGEFFYAATFGRRSFAGVDTSAFHIFDVANPAAPLLLNVIFDNHFWAFSLAVRDGIAYLGASSGLHVLDVSDPRAVTELGFMDFYSAPVAMEFVGNLLHLVGMTGELHIVDLTDPANLVLLSTTDLKVGRAEALSVHDGMAVIACRGSGLRVVDVTDPTSPSGAASWPSTGRCHGVLLEESRVCILETDRLLVAEDEFPRFVEPTSTLALDIYPRRQILADGLLYYLDRELHIVDVSDPAMPVEIGLFWDGTFYNRMSLDGSLLYLASIGGGGTIAVDVSDPANPVKLSSLSTEQAYSIHAADGLVAVGPRSGVVSLYDVTNPAVPFLLGSHTGVSPYRAYGVAIVGDYLYLHTGTTSVLDISDPTNIHTVASFETGFGLDLVADGEWIYTSDGDMLTVLRFTSPTTLELQSSLAIPEYVEDLHLRDAILSVACKKGGVHVFDVADPTAPVRLGALTAAEDTRCVTASEDIVVIGSATYPVANDGWIEIYPALCTVTAMPESWDGGPTWPLTLSASPNPFNPRVSFAFSVPLTGRVELSVFDLRGRRVVTLLDEFCNAGPQRFDWNGLDAAGRPAASGGYVARLQVAGTAVSRQVTLVR